MNKASQEEEMVFLEEGLPLGLPHIADGPVADLGGVVLAATWGSLSVGSKYIESEPGD